jgi:hypothetical protein
MKIMKKIILITLLSFLSFGAYLFGQGCGGNQGTDFNDGTVMNWMVTTDGTNAGVFAEPVNNLYRIRDLTSPPMSRTYNEINFIGINNGTLCWDVDLWSDASPNTLDYYPSITIYSGTLATAPDDFMTLAATFTAFDAITESIPGPVNFVTVCTPIFPATNGNLPTSTEGAWTISGGSDVTGNDVDDWTSLLSNITGIYIEPEIISNAGESFGIDNVCYSPCIDNPTIVPNWALIPPNAKLCDLNSFQIHVLDDDGNPLSTSDGFQFEWVSPNGITSSSSFVFASPNESWTVEITGPNGCEYTVTYQLCCVEPCEVISDLTACAEEGDYGFIVIDCPDDYYFFWEGGGTDGSAAIEISCAGQSILLQAAQGTYDLTVENNDGDGCEVSYSWEIIEDCCEEKCPAPTRLSCEPNNLILLEWEQVPNASEYLVTITPNAEACDCEGIQSDPITVEVGDNEYFIPYTLYSCFSWSVSSICADGQISEPSTLMCFTGGQDCSEAKGENLNLITNKERKETNESTQNSELVSFSPNPTAGEVNILLELETESNVQLEVLDIQGKRVDEVLYLDQLGKVNLTWNANAKLSGGTYFFKITTSSWTTSKKLLILKE